MFLSEWCEFSLAPCLAGKNLDDSSCLNVVEIARVLTCFRACFLPGQAKDLSAPWYSRGKDRTAKTLMIKILVKRDAVLLGS